MSHHEAAPVAGSATLRLRPGLRVSRRGDGQLQVGLHPGRRAVLPDTEDVRRLLRDLGHGVRTAVVPAALAGPLDTLRARGLLDAPDLAVTRTRLLESARVGVVASDPVRATAVRMLATAGLQVAGRRGAPTVVLHVTTGAEPRRADLDRWVREDRPHLTLTALAGRTTLGPFVVPGVTACLRCVDDHLTDRDPRHPLVLAQHHAPDPRDQVPAEDVQLALAWAVRDLVRWVRGTPPVTWSATVELDDAGPTVRAWGRHPRCGCAWGDVLAG
jgi:hypothetical protein